MTWDELRTTLEDLAAARVPIHLEFWTNVQTPAVDITGNHLVVQRGKRGLWEGDEVESMSFRLGDEPGAFAVDADSLGSANWLPDQEPNQILEIRYGENGPLILLHVGAPTAKR